VARAHRRAIGEPLDREPLAEPLALGFGLDSITRLAAISVAILSQAT
jgi:hypothetical protein